MTVDERLRAAHARIPDPDEATIARARALLPAEAGERRCRNGARSVRFLHRRARGTRPAPSPRRRGPLPARGRFGALRLALPLVALALAAVAAVAIVPRGAERPVGVGGDVLYQRDTVHMYVRVVEEGGRPERPEYTIARSVSEELWLAPDGSGRVVHGTLSKPVPLGPEDEAAWRRAGAPDLAKLLQAGPRRPMRTDYGPGALARSRLEVGNLDAVLAKRDPLAAVPVERLALRDFLVRAARKQRPHGSAQTRRNTFGQDVLTLLAYPESTRALRASLLGLVRNLAGARELGELTDPAGRTVRAFQLPDNMAHGAVVAYDPATDTLMASGRMTAGRLEWTTTYAITRSHVAGVGDRP